MKQRISVEQLNELTDEQRESLREWWKPEQGDYFSDGQRQFVAGNIVRNGDIVKYGEDMPHGKDGLIPLLSIGQMTHFLYEETNDWGIHYNDSGVFFTVYLSWNMETARMSGRLYSSDELVDALWDAVKAVL